MYRFLALFLLFQTALAQSDEIENVLNQTNYEPGYFGMIFGLFTVIVLIYLTGFLYKKLTKIKFDNTDDEKYKVEIVSSTPLGQNKNLYVIKVNSKYSLIGASQNAITYLKDIEEDNAD
ncbi:FliO/MopB family protein [bacterium]|nr:FliO/MopB family protein [bacterium]